ASTRMMMAVTTPIVRFWFSLSVSRMPKFCSWLGKNVHVDPWADKKSVSLSLLWPGDCRFWALPGFRRFRTIRLAESNLKGVLYVSDKRRARSSWRDGRYSPVRGAGRSEYSRSRRTGARRGHRAV